MHGPGERTLRPSLARVRLTGGTEPLDLDGEPVAPGKACRLRSPKPTHPMHPTWVLATSTPLDETDDKQDQHQEGDGAHEPNEPALGGDVGLAVGVSWWEGGPEADT